MNSENPIYKMYRILTKFCNRKPSKYRNLVKTCNQSVKKYGFSDMTKGGQI